MAKHTKEFGVIGLGRMGGGLAHQAMKKGMRVAGYDVGGATPELIGEGLIEVKELKDFVKSLPTPRAILLYVPSGPIVDQVIDELTPVLVHGDIICDGGNSYWGDSIRRARRLKERGIYFCDVGTSGGVDGARNGACFMVGGERVAVERIEPILLDLCADGGYVHAGPPGAGHYVKLVHNGIEWGIMQAMGEGMDLLENYRDKLNIPDVLHSWRFGSVIRSWLIDLMEQAYRDKGGLDNVPSYIDDTGEVSWLVGDAMRMEVPIPVIAQSVMQYMNTRDTRQNWARAIALLRNAFGQHAMGPDPAVKAERQTGRVGDWVPLGE